MKASEARSLASRLIAERREEKEKNLVPFLNDPEVEKAVARVIALVRERIEVAPKYDATECFAIPISDEGPKRDAFFKRLHNDGYELEFYSGERMTVRW